jgi:hypothetical protein
LLKAGRVTKNYKIISIKIYGIMFYNSTPESISICKSSATFSVLEIRNNIMHPAGIRGNLDKIPPKSESNNYIFTSNSESVFQDVSNLPTGFIRTSGIDLEPNNNGLSLESGSPALDYGINLGSEYSPAINSVPRPTDGAWDAGAYEKNTSNEPIPGGCGNLKK